jgi:hypothetical protein
MDRDGRLITTPPRLNLMRITTHAFQRIVDQYLWQFAIDKDEDDEGSDIAKSHPQQIPTLGSQPAASAEVANTPTTAANKKRKLNDAVLLTDVPDDNEVRRLYPHLCQALGLDDRFDPTNPSIQKSMVALLTELNCFLSTEYELVI